MNRLRNLLWLAVALIAGIQPLYGQDERILAYHSDIEIQGDGSMTVSEQITVRSQQRNIRRGIYRDFPTRYRDRLGNRVIVDFEVIEVLRDGQPEPWFTEGRPNGVRVNTGNDDLLPGPGDYTFTIRYRTNHQLGFFDTHDELYWNVTGLGWDFVIDSASASVELPQAVSGDQMTLHHYTGPAGSRTSHAQAEVRAPGVVRFFTDQPLAPGEGLTIAVEFPKGLVEAPTTIDQLGRFLRNNRGMLVLLLGGLGILVFYVRAWLTKGRGPAPGVIIARYDPPQGYSPGGLRYVWKEHYDHGCFTADLVALAVGGKVAIKHETKFLGERWTLRKIGQRQTGELTPSQAALLDKLFEKDSSVELKSANAERIQAAMAGHTKALHKRFKGTYLNPNARTLVIGCIASLLLCGLAFVLAGGPSAALVITSIVIMLINMVFIGLMPAPTERGRRLLDHVEGLKLYLSVAEKQDLARLQRPDAAEPSLTPERFEYLLPFALALEVEEAWTDKFTAAVGQAMAERTRSSLAWYTGSGAAIGSLSGMSQSLGKSLSSNISSAASPPGSSSGGGGFSGGGGGGGGGGGR
ncbi:MAG: DUF2207 domain-containing protein [Wenzhouxiangella sp.]|jgi:uncharacterized membrane protein YgcG|nr:DUF2207 domain-containing protein [Wenzhouxiangella sp.]